jgi:hypothetical protein
MQINTIIKGLVFVLLFIPEITQSQSLTNSSFGFSNGYLKSDSGISLTFSAGEAVTGTFGNSEISFSAPNSVTSTIVPTSAETFPELPSAIRLYQNFPNPFNPSTTIVFDLSRQSTIKVLVYSLIGNRVAEFDMGTKPAGQHQLNINASTWASGIYLYTLNVDGAFHSSRKLMLIK